MRILVATTLQLRASAVALAALTSFAGPRAPAPQAVQRGLGATTPAADALNDEFIAPFRTELLALAFEAATALPIDPHIKTRSRLQEAVVAACLELRQPKRASEYLQSIADWRRGACYADLAAHLARNGSAEPAERYVELARAVEESLDDQTNQAWRRERIRAKLAKAHHELGRPEDAAAFEAGLTTLQAVEVAPLNAARVDEHNFEAQMSAVESAVETGDLDALCGALETCARLCDRYFDDEAKRTRLEGTLRTSWFKLPLTMRFELMLELAHVALEHGDSAIALQLAAEARAALDGSKLSAQYTVPMMAEVARVRHRAGDAERARKDADAALALFVEQREQVIDIYRAGALRPLAEAYHAMGDERAALDVYKRAVEEGVVNPNSRPRAEDISATCLSLALHAVEPDEALAKRLAEIRAGLGNPW